MELTKILSDRYGAGPGIFDPTPILWAADKAADLIGVDAAKAELKQLNQQRSRLALPVACPEYGHRLF
jgi:hypothetical protein